MGVELLAVLAAVEALREDVAVAGLALADFGAFKGRGERHRLSVERGEVLLIDESYNANPASMAATLKSLGAEIGVDRRIAVLGGHARAWRAQRRAHAGLAAAVIGAKVEELILVGDETRPLEAALAGQVRVSRAADADDAARVLARACFGPAMRFWSRPRTRSALPRSSNASQGELRPCST